MKIYCVLIFNFFLSASSVALAVEADLEKTNMNSVKAESGCVNPQNTEGNFNRSYIPSEGYVPNAETAIKIAVAVWEPIYGVKKIAQEKPYKAKLINGIWYVSGSLKSGWHGGVAEIEICKESAQVIRLSHGK